MCIRDSARAASASPPTVLLLGHAARIEAGIRATLTSEWRVEAVADSAAALREAVARRGGRVAAVVAAPPCAAYFREAMAALPGLALLQVLSAGHEFVAMDAVPRGAAVCNSSSMDVPIAEYCAGQDKGDSTSLQRECSARARSGKSIHASRPFREMIARPKISRNEWKTAEI